MEYQQTSRLSRDIPFARTLWTRAMVGNRGLDTRRSGVLPLTLIPIWSPTGKPGVPSQHLCGRHHAEALKSELRRMHVQSSADEAVVSCEGGWNFPISEGRNPVQPGALHRLRNLRARLPKRCAATRGQGRLGGTLPDLRRHGNGHDGKKAPGRSEPPHQKAAGTQVRRKNGQRHPGLRHRLIHGGGSWKDPGSTTTTVSSLSRFVTQPRPQSKPWKEPTSSINGDLR